MGRLNLVASNPVKDGIDAFTALSANYRADDAAKLAAAKDARDATTQGLQQQMAQHQLDEQDNQKTVRQLSAIDLAVKNDVPLSADQQAMLSKNVPVDQGTVVSGAIPVTTPDDPRKDIASAAMKSMDMGPPSWAKISGNKTVMQGQLSDVFTKMSQNPGYIPSLPEAELLMRQVVNSAGIDDKNIGGQQQALQEVTKAAQYIGTIKQPTKLTSASNPNEIEAFNAAYPKFASQSNLTNANVTSLFITPSPDGDPAKAQIIVGVSGFDKDGNMVDGVVTQNRSSDPSDNVVRLTTGELSTQAQQKLLTLKGLDTARVAYGDLTVMPKYEKIQEGRKYAKSLADMATTMEPGPARDEVNMISAQVLQGMTPEHASAMVDKIQKPVRDKIAAEQATRTAANKHQYDLELEAAKHDRLKPGKEIIKAPAGAVDANGNPVPAGTLAYEGFKDNNPFYTPTILQAVNIGGGRGKSPATPPEDNGMQLFVTRGNRDLPPLLERVPIGSPAYNRYMSDGTGRVLPYGGKGQMTQNQAYNASVKTNPMTVRTSGINPDGTQVSAVIPKAPPSARQAGRSLDAATAQQFLKQSGGDKNKARALAAQSGYSF